MYCKGCGKEVADDSKYCQYCGIKLTNNANATNKCSLLLSVLAKVKLSNKAKTILSHYMVWFVINMICLIFYDKNRDASDWLFPFVSTDLRDYDGSEFILYTLLMPYLIYWGITIYNKSKKWHYKIFCVNGNTGFRNESRIFYFIHLQNEEAYERKESSSA